MQADLIPPRALALPSLPQGCPGKFQDGFLPASPTVIFAQTPLARACPRPGCASGFTLIEAIIALVILSGSVIVFYNFLTTALNSADRVQAASIAYDRHMNALALVTSLNPMDFPDGVFDLGTYHIQWASQILGNVRQSSRYPTGRGIFKVGLYRITLSFPDDSQMAPITVTRLGYRRDDLPDSPMGGPTN
jgi:general secretion pathway protein I